MASRSLIRRGGATSGGANCSARSGRVKAEKKKFPTLDFMCGSQVHSTTIQKYLSINNSITPIHSKHRMELGVGGVLYHITHCWGPRDILGFVFPLSECSPNAHQESQNALTTELWRSLLWGIFPRTDCLVLGYLGYVEGLQARLELGCSGRIERCCSIQLSSPPYVLAHWYLRAQSGELRKSEISLASRLLWKNCSSGRRD